MNKKVAKCCKNLVYGLAKKVAERDANTACAFLSYQPKQPEKVKKLRKF